MKRQPDYKRRLRVRIQKNVAIHPITGCWVWKLRKNNGGYAVMSVRVEGYLHPVKLLVHRVSYEVFKRKPRAGHVIAHSIRCVSPACCNPEHLRATTQASNCRDIKRAARWRERYLREVFPPVHELERAAA